MQIQELYSNSNEDGIEQRAQTNWVVNASLLWEHRRRLARFTVIAFAVSLAIAFIIPKSYKSNARIMPPDQSGSSGALIAALTGHSLGGRGGLGGLATSLLGVTNTSALFVDLLRSGTVTGHLIDRFNLQHVYRKRYRVDAAKYLVRHTTVVDDKKSGVISIEVEDRNPLRARDLVQAYLDELDKLVNRTNTSSAHQERIFIERRLKSVQSDLERAQLEFSQFSSTHTTIDIKEQTRAIVDAAAKLQGQLIVSQSEVGSLRQIYGDGNVRVRAAEARVSALQHELTKMSGTSAILPRNSDKDLPSAESKDGELYPSLRQLPRLAVPYADLYRRVRVQEAVFELLTQEYEMARIQEAKDVPVISVIDSPGVPEKKSFPPRLVVTLALTLLSTGSMSIYIVSRHHWVQVRSADPRKALAQEVSESVRSTIRRYVGKSRGPE